MRLELNGHALLLGHTQPTFDQRHHILEPDGHHLADDDHKGRGDALRQPQCRAQLFDGCRKCGQGSGQSGARELRNRGFGLRHAERAKIDRHTVESRFQHAIEFFRHRRFGRRQSIHRPQGLMDQQAITHAARRRSRYCCPDNRLRSFRPQRHATRQLETPSRSWTAEPRRAA